MQYNHTDTEDKTDQLNIIQTNSAKARTKVYNTSQFAYFAIYIKHTYGAGWNEA